MSSREPLWYCHECHAEMRPLMVPDPACASCHGSFVEMIEGPSDDPRNFAHDHGDPDGDLGDMPQGLGALLLGLQSVMDRGMRENNTTRNTTGSSFTFEVRGPGTRSVRIGGPTTLGGESPSAPGSPRAVPSMSTFLRSDPMATPPPAGGQDRSTISGPMMAQYLMALLGHRDPLLFGGAGPENGRMGDYVFNQEALDQIMTQLMENNNSHRPIPATEEIMAKLPREVLMEGSATLQQDCAVCKDQFKLGTEDPDEQVVITLPCKHPFHEPCIMPWLKSSGTCPVCRYALIEQPEHHPPPTQGPGSSGSGRRSSGSSGPSDQPGPGASNRAPESGGFFHSIFGGLTGHGNHNSANRTSSRSTPSWTPSQQSPRRSTSNPTSPSPSSPSQGRQNRSRRDQDPPGAWSEDLD